MVPRAGPHRPTCPKPASRGTPHRGTGTEPARPNAGLGGGSDNDGRTPGYGTPASTGTHACARVITCTSPVAATASAHRPTDVHIRMICTHLPHRRFSWSAAHSRRSGQPAAQPQAGLLTLRNCRPVVSRFPPGGRDAHEVVADIQRVTVPAMLTINDAACSWRMTRNTGVTAAHGDHDIGGLHLAGG